MIELTMGLNKFPIQTITQSVWTLISGFLIGLLLFKGSLGLNIFDDPARLRAASADSSRHHPTTINSICTALFCFVFFNFHSKVLICK